MGHRTIPNGTSELNFCNIPNENRDTTDFFNHYSPNIFK